jgi:hypothetical protein
MSAVERIAPSAAGTVDGLVPAVAALPGLDANRRWRQG